MTLEQTIQSMYDKYPTLFKERADCLNHLFCTIGNGYEWKGGELVGWNDYDDDYIKHLESEMVNGKAYQHHKYSLRDDYIANDYIAEKFINPYDKYYTVENRVYEILNEPDDVYYEEPDRKKRWNFYLQGYSQFERIRNVPNNVKDDWLNGVRECAELLLEDGYDLVTPIDTEANRKQYLSEYKKRFYEKKECKITQKDIADYIHSGKPLYKHDLIKNK